MPRGVQMRVCPELRDLMLERKRRIEGTVRIKQSMMGISRTIAEDIKILEQIKPIQTIEKKGRRKYLFKYDFRI